MGFSGAKPLVSQWPTCQGCLSLPFQHTAESPGLQNSSFPTASSGGVWGHWEGWKNTVFSGAINDMRHTELADRFMQDNFLLQ